MAWLIQLVLLAVFAVYTHSYSLPQRTSHSEPDAPIEFDDLDNKSDAYPQEYIDKLVSELSLEDREKLKIDRTLIDRQGNPGSQFCGWHTEITSPQYARAKDDHKDYYVVQPKIDKDLRQDFKIHACNKYGDHCFENATIHTGYKGCCIMQNEVFEMLVLSVPMRNYLCNKPQGEIIKKNMYLPATCSCVTSNYILDDQELGKKCHEIYRS